MNKLWLGIGLMVILLAGGIGLLWGSTVFFNDFSRNVEEAGELALVGDWSAATEKMVKTQRKWERYRRFWASFTDHEPMEQMQTLLSQIELYRKEQLEVEFASACRALSHVAEAIEESHSLRWWSVL